MLFIESRKSLHFVLSSIIIIFVRKKIENSKPAERQRHKAKGPKENILWLPAANSKIIHNDIMTLHNLLLSPCKHITYICFLFVPILRI